MQWHPTPVLLPGNSHRQRSLVSCSPWGRQELDTTERLHFHFSLSCIGEGNGNPLQCSCLENPRDGRAWWAAVCGVAQSRTRLKGLSSSSMKGEINNNTIIVGGFNTPLTPMERSTKQKINKETQTLNDIIDQLDLIDICRTIHPKTMNFTFFSYTEPSPGQITSWAINLALN